MRYVAVRKLGCQTSGMAKFLRMAPARVSMAARRGAKAADQGLAEQLLAGEGPAATSKPAPPSRGLAVRLQPYLNQAAVKSG